MRLFVALDLPAHVRAALGVIVDDLPTAPGLRWEAPERWHVTLAFLGEVADDGELQERLERAARRTDELRLALDGLGRFGNRVLYASVAGDRRALHRLAQRVAAAARRSGIDAPHRFHPHVTLARARQGVDLRPVVEAAREPAQGKIQWTAQEVVLVESLLPRTYRVRRGWPLRAAR